MALDTQAGGRGLSRAEVREARRRHGRPLRRAGAGRSYRQIVRANVFTLFNNILFGIGIALLALGRIGDAVVSAGLGLLNALISAVQEMRAKRALDALKRQHGGRVPVLRADGEVEVPPEEVVVGDLVRLAPGDEVLLPGPLEGAGSVEVVEPGADTRGHPGPVTRVAGQWLAPGAVVVAGTGHQRVHAEGPDGSACAPAPAAPGSPSRTPLQQRIDQVIRLVIVVAALMSAAILAQALMEGLPTVRVVQISAVLSGLVPYGLFLLVTLSYSVGAATIARHGVLVQQVNAVESLSNVDVLCCDTTGTLTTGRLRLHAVSPLHPAVGEEDVTSLLGTLAAASSAPDAVTSALREALPSSPVPLEEEVPLSTARGWGGAVLDDPATGARRCLVLGSVDVLRPALEGPDPASGGGDLDAVLHPCTAQGLRVLLLAQATGAGAGLRDATGAAALPALTALAVVALGEELRPGTREALAEMRSRGVSVVLLSDEDRSSTAAVAALLGLPREGSAGETDLLAQDPSSVDEWVQRHPVLHGLSRDGKERVVDALVRAGHYVAVAGDGVVDTAALQRAHVGISTRSGSSAARDVADVVLLEDSLAALPLAHRQGQRIVGAIAPVMMLFLTRVAVSMGVILGVSVLGLGFPYEPAQGSLTLFTVGLPSLLLTAWARPRRPDPHLILRLLYFVVPAAVVTGGFAIALYAALFTLLSRLLRRGVLPEDAIARWEGFTGLDRDDPAYVESAATAVAQMGLSTFTCMAAFLLILFLEPPARFFTGWAPVSPDKRPALLVLALFLVLFVVLQFPALAGYFGLVQPGGFEPDVVVGTAVVWFFVMRTVWRRDLMRRALALPPPPPS